MTKKVAKKSYVAGPGRGHRAADIKLGEYLVNANVLLTPRIRDAYRKLGGGNLSRGIRLAAAKVF